MHGTLAKMGRRRPSREASDVRSIPWSSDEVQAFSELVREPLSDPSKTARFEFDDEWNVESVRVDPGSSSVVELVLVHGDTGKRLTLRCEAFALSPDGPYQGAADLYSVRLHELAGAIGLDRLEDGDVIDGVALLYDARVTGPARPHEGVRLGDLEPPGGRV